MMMSEHQNRPTPTTRKPRRQLRLLVLLTAAGTAFGLVTIFGSWWLIQREASFTFDHVDDLPARAVGLVPGCSPLLADGRANLFFGKRIDAAAAAFHSGKVRHLLVSGDNRTHSYNEPEAMKAALIARGVPEHCITCDYAGLTTLDSVVRAREVFGQDNLTVISQPFHNRRAIFIARHRGIDLIGFNAADVTSHHALRTRAREAVARVRAVFDSWIWRRQPRHLGEPVPLPVASAPSPGVSACQLFNFPPCIPWEPS